MKNKLNRPLFPVVCAIPLFLLLITSCSKLEYQVIDKNSKVLSEMQQDKPYIIGCGDKMKINVWRHEELSLDLVVMPDGKISLPLIGEIHVAGLTVEEFKDELNRKFAEYISEPHVTIAITEINSLKIFILGQYRDNKKRGR
ncbi:MAG: polysaccharide biosynthesis/export family protein [Proteobacteria bacterium]|nr:polysaccharide biosynthesis/export family protein [Pseudomonadota bacterium]